MSTQPKQGELVPGIGELELAHMRSVLGMDPDRVPVPPLSIVVRHHPVAPPNSLEACRSLEAQRPSWSATALTPTNDRLVAYGDTPADAVDDLFAQIRRRYLEP